MDTTFENDQCNNCGYKPLAPAPDAPEVVTEEAEHVETAPVEEAEVAPVPEGPAPEEAVI